MKIKFGFLKQKSTIEQKIEFTDFCYSAIVKQEITLSVLLDFSKAFNTIEHDHCIIEIKLYSGRRHEQLV